MLHKARVKLTFDMISACNKNQSGHRTLLNKVPNELHFLHVPKEI